LAQASPSETKARRPGVQYVPGARLLAMGLSPQPLQMALFGKKRLRGDVVVALATVERTLWGQLSVRSLLLTLPSPAFWLAQAPCPSLAHPARLEMAAQWALASRWVTTGLEVRPQQNQQKECAYHDALAAVEAPPLSLHPEVQL